jgi:hypothetical protein
MYVLYWVKGLGRKEISVHKTWEAVEKQVSQVAMRDWVQGEEQNGETAW